MIFQVQTESISTWKVIIHVKASLVAEGALILDFSLS